MSADQSIILFEVNKVNNLPELVELVDVVREEVKGLIGPAHSARVNNLFFFTASFNSRPSDLPSPII